MLSDGVAKTHESERTFADGELIVRRGDTGREMFVIRSGAAVVVRQQGDREIVLAEFGRGEFFGEMALLESEVRDADVRARGETQVLVLGPGALLLRLRRDPSFGLELLQKLSGRVRVLNERLEKALSEQHLTNGASDA